MRLPVSSYRRRDEWTRPYPCDTVLDERYVRTSVVVVCAQNCTVNTHRQTAPRATRAHTISLHTPLHLLYDRPPLATPTPLARPLHRTLSIKSLPEDTPRTQRRTRTHTHTPLSSLGATPPLFTRAPLLPPLAPPALLYLVLTLRPLYTAHSSFVPSSESQHPPPELTPCKAPHQTDSWRGDSPALVTIPPSYPHRFHPPSGSSETAGRLSYTSQTHQIRHPHSCR